MTTAKTLRQTRGPEPDISSYEPRAGSIAARVYAILLEDGETSGADLAELVECDPPSLLQNSLTVALREGLIKKRMLSGRNMYRARGKPVLQDPQEPPPYAGLLKLAGIDWRDHAPLKQRLVSASDTVTPALPTFQWPPRAELKTDCASCRSEGLWSCNCMPAFRLSASGGLVTSDGRRTTLTASQTAMVSALLREMVPA